MKKRIVSLLLVCLLCLGLALSACGRTNPDTPEPETLDLKALEGYYTEEYAHRGRLLFSSADGKTASIVIEWPDSASVLCHWEMTGSYNPEAQAIVYSDAVLIVKTFAENNTETDQVSYTRGTGSFVLSNGKLYWTEDNNPERGVSSFVYEMSLADYQSSQSSIVKPADATPAGTTPAPVITPMPTTAPIPTTAPAPTATPAPTAKPTATPAPSATPAPNALPEITKSPTDEEVTEGGSCMFIAKYRNAIWAVWHFVSPDKQTDLTYEAAAERFPTLEIVNGMYSTMTLRNVPLELNGWSVYCRYSNNAGHVDTKSAKITVKPAPSPSPTATPAPTVTPAPTTTPAPTATPAPTDPPLGPVINAWVETTDLDEAVTGSGVSFTPPASDAYPDLLTLKTYRYMTGIIEADYYNRNGQTVLVIRKSTTTGASNLSGDFNVYSQAWDLTLKNITVSCLGDGEKINTATYDNGKEYFSISYCMGEEGSGLTADQLSALMDSIK